jgi:hypothetical protein
MIGDMLTVSHHLAVVLAKIYPTCGCGADFSEQSALLVQQGRELAIPTDLRLLCFPCAIKEGLMVEAMADPTSMESVMMEQRQKEREASAESFEKLLAKSSFGTPAALALSKRTPAHVAAEIVRRVNEKIRLDEESQRKPS